MTAPRIRFHVQAYDREGTAYEPALFATQRQAEAEFRVLVRGADDDPDLERIHIWPASQDDPLHTADISGMPIATWVRPRTPTAARRQRRRPAAEGAALPTVAPIPTEAPTPTPTAPTPPRRGRQAQPPAPIPPARPIRPGFIVREALQRFGPMSIAELHRSYKQQVRDHNRGRAKKRRPMSYHSFHRYMHQMRLLGLVVNVDEKPMRHPPDPNPLIHWSDGGNPGAREAVQVVVDLTAQGRRHQEAFHNLFPKAKPG